MKKLYYLFAFFCLFFILNAKAANSPQLLDRVVAVVNDDVITQTELSHRITAARKELAATNTPITSQEKLQTQVLNQMIDHTLELQMAKRYGIDISEAALNQAIEDIGSRNHVTLTTLQTMVTHTGMTWTEYRKQLKDQMLVRELLERAVGSSIHITAQEIKNAMNSPEYLNRNVSEYDLGDILIPLSEEPSSLELHQATEKANKILAQLKNGAKFNALAATHSSGSTAFSGGDLGWKSLSDLPTVFENIVKKMKTDDITGPIRTGNGLHIIKLLGVKEKHTKHFMTQTEVRHILIKTQSTTDDHLAKNKIEKIRQELINHGDFETLAKAYSEDLGSASKGGSLGWVAPGLLVQPFEKAMNTLPIGQISEPVKTQYGWHIIQVLGRKQVEDTPHYQEQEIKQMIYQRKFQEEAQNWIQRMKDASYIKTTL